MAGDYLPSWIELEKTLGRTAMNGSPHEIRAQYQQLTDFLKPQIELVNSVVESQDGYVDKIRYRKYTPPKNPNSKPSAVIIWTHGGGWMVGDLDQDDSLCRTVAEHLEAIVISVDYRLSPEWKYPTQLQDTLTVFEWAYENAAAIGGDRERFYTFGGSAGGALALQVASHLVKDPTTRNRIKGVAAVVPVTLHYDHIPPKFRSRFNAYDENAVNVPVIDKNSMATFFEHAAVNGEDPGAFVALDVQNHKNFPPTYIVTCEKDPLRDDGAILEYALSQAEVPTKRDHWLGLPHYFWIFPSVPEGKEFVRKLLSGLDWLFNQPRSM